MTAAEMIFVGYSQHPIFYSAQILELSDYKTSEILYMISTLHHINLVALKN